MKYCKNCAFADKNICRLHDNMEIDREGPGCAKGTANVATCAICGRLVINYILIYKEDDPTDVKPVCEKCYQASQTCQLCGNATQCAFETSSISLPKVVVQTQRFGNQVMQTQVKNPARVEATCAAGCPCYDKTDKECNREIGLCANHRSIL